LSLNSFTPCLVHIFETSFVVKIVASFFFVVFAFSASFY